MPEWMTADVPRRAVLSAAGAGAAAATAGCFSRLRDRVAYSPSEQATLTVACTPADRDPSATAIARHLRDNLDAVGVDVTLELLGEQQLLRDAMLNHDFDAVVSRVPGHAEPDELRQLLHSRFAEEEGRQNPFGYGTRSMDALLERQRRQGGEQRVQTLAEIQRLLAHEQPVVPLARPLYQTAVSSSFDLEGPSSLADGLGYLLAEPDDGAPERLDVALLTDELSVNRNLLGVEFRLRDPLLDLLYDQPVRRVDGQYVPWLAESWSVLSDGGDSGTDGDGASTDDGAAGEDGAGEDGTATGNGAAAGTTVEVRLRRDLRWHDGTELTASDVAFTYEFLRDTALGETESPVPAPRYRSQSSLVTDATAPDDRTVRLELRDVDEALVPHVLTVPVLPPQTWRERSEPDRQYLTQALLDDVTDPVGSGPLQFESASPEESVTLSRFDEHFLRTASELPEALAPFSDGPAYRRLAVSIAPNVSSAVGNVADGEVDVVGGVLTPRHVSQARDRNGVRVREESTDDYYGVWFNVRRSPLAHYGFRAAVAQLLDRDYLVEAAFDGYATATETPLADPAVVSEDLVWDGTSVSGAFPGEDGELDVQAARDLFRDAGFRYHDDELRARQ